MRASVLAVLALVAWLYAPGFGGYWLGDDFGHLHQTFNWSQDGRLWTETLGKFAAPADAIGHFYRPLIFVTMSANFSLFGTHYAGWFLTNLLLHLASTWLVMWVVRRAAAVLDLDARIPSVLAALVFAASPLLVEGVMWLSARSDLAVTAMALLAAGLWLGPERKQPARIDARCLIPVLVVIALGFKESAAVLPLQLLLLAFARPVAIRRGGWIALAGTALAVAVFLVLRAWWFDSAWHAYNDGGDRHLRDALLSLPQWWRGVAQAAPAPALAWLAGSLMAAFAALRFGPGAAPRMRIAIAFACAGAGQLLATLLNLGVFAGNGEGGRLLYGPIAWFALSLGVLLLADSPQSPRAALVRHQAAMAFATFAAVAGLVASHARIAQFTAVQGEMRDLVSAIAGHASKHPGITVLAIPDQRMGIVAGRNGQGALALPPLQSSGLLNRVLPTLPDEMALRPAQFARGLGTQLELLKPVRADVTTLGRLLDPAPPGGTPDYACWSSQMRTIVALPALPPEKIDAQSCDGIR